MICMFAMPLRVDTFMCETYSFVRGHRALTWRPAFIFAVVRRGSSPKDRNSSSSSLPTISVENVSRTAD